MTNETIITSCRFFADELEQTAKKMKRKNERLYAEADNYTEEQMLKYWAALNHAVNEADKVYRMCIGEEVK